MQKSTRERWIRTGLLLMGFMMTGSLTAWSQEAPISQDDAIQSGLSYAIGVSDVLRISVWKQDNLEVVVPVRPDGRISVPLLGEVDVVGRTPEDVRAELTSGYERFVTAPMVSIVVEEINSRRFFVLGEVDNPGAYDMTTPTSILQALAIAGGFTEFAKKDEVVVIKLGGGLSRRLVVSVKAITSGKDLFENLLLQPGDTVYVP